VQPHAAQPHLQPAQVAGDQRLHVGVGGRRAEPLPLAHLRRDLARQRHRQIRHCVVQDVAHAALMGRVDEAVQEADRDALHALPPQHRDEFMHRVLVERQQHGALVVEPLRHRQAQVARHQRLRQGDVEVVLVVAALVAHRQHVPKPLGRDQRRPRALALDDGVGGERCAVYQDAHVRRHQPGPAQDGRNPVQHPALRLRSRGQHLGGRPPAAMLQRQIRERAADIDREPR